MTTPLHGVMTFEYVPLEAVDLHRALLVTGMPAVGMEGPLAAGLLAEQLNMRMIGMFHSDDMTPVTAVRDGIATAPIQVYAAELACGTDGHCDRLLVMKSDIALDPEHLPRLATAVTRWCKTAHIELVICLETFLTEPDTESTTVLCATSAAARAMKGSIVAAAMEDILLTGFAAALLNAGTRDGLPVVGIFAPTRDDDSESPVAARLLNVADPLIPKLDLNESRIHELLEKKSAQLRRERTKHAEETRAMRDRALSGYV